MKNFKNRGFIIIIVLAFLAVLVLVASVVVNIGCGEMLQTRARNSYINASYVAMAAADMMYAKLKNRSTIYWPQTISGNLSTRFTGGQTIGSFTVTANTVSSDILGVVSEGTVAGHRSRISVKYKFASPYTNGVPIGSPGPIQLSGQRFLVLRSWVRADGPITSGSTVSTNSYVQIKGDTTVLENQDIPAPSFWWKLDNPETDSWSLKAKYDTYGTGDTQMYITDVNGDGAVTLADALGDTAKEAIFRTNDINSDGAVDDKDAFQAFYTVELNKKNLGLAPGQTNNYVGNYEFGPGDVPQGKTIIFVNGDVNIAFNDQNWARYACDHTIVATGNVNIVQPTNGSDDRITIVAWGDVNTGGIRAFGGIRGEMVVYANGSFNAYYGGRIDGTITAKESVYVDTVLPIPGLLNRDINKGKDDWGDAANKPLGLPIGYPILSSNFSIDETQRPVWERN